MSAKRFRIAFSFAGEKRGYVAKIAAILAQHFGEASILYDKYHEAEFARSDLGIYLPDLYHKRCDLVVMVVCPDYSQKEWTGLEWTAIHDLLKKRKVEEVLLTRFNHAEVTGLYSTAGFIELDDKTPEQTATLILERLGLNEGYPKDHYTKSDEPSKTSIPNNLPRLQYFFGREKELQRIADALAHDARGWGALIDGPGGIGKTALAIRAAESVPSARFRRIIFLSSKERELTADGQRALGYFVVPTYLEMLNAIAPELGRRTLRNRRKVNAPNSSCAPSVMPTCCSCSITSRPSRSPTATSFSPFSTACRAGAAPSSPAVAAQMPAPSSSASTGSTGRPPAPSSPSLGAISCGSARPATTTVAPSTRRPAAIPCSSAGSRASSVSDAAATLPPRSISCAAPRRGTTRWSSSSATCWTPSPRAKPKRSPRSPISPLPWS